MTAGVKATKAQVEERTTKVVELLLLGLKPREKDRLGAFCQANRQLHPKSHAEH
jgi:hypothetical protein